MSSLRADSPCVICGLTGKDVIPGTETLHMDTDYDVHPHWNEENADTLYILGYTVARDMHGLMSVRDGIAQRSMYKMGYEDGAGDRLGL